MKLRPAFVTESSSERHPGLRLCCQAPLPSLPTPESERVPAPADLLLIVTDNRRGAGSSGAPFFARFFGSASWLCGHTRNVPSPFTNSIRYGTIALRTGLIDQLHIRRKVTLRILHAPIKRVPPLRLPHRDVPTTLRAGNLQQLLLHVLALWIAGAGNKLPVRTVPQQQRLSTLRDNPPPTPPEAFAEPSASASESSCKADRPSTPGNS